MIGMHGSSAGVLDEQGKKLHFLGHLGVNANDIVWALLSKLFGSRTMPLWYIYVRPP